MAATVQFILAAGCLALFCVLSLFLLTGFYQQPAGRFAHRLRSLCQRWEFTVADLGRFRWFQLALASGLSLFLEMLMIRWIAAEVPVFAYFKNVVLIGCFLGFGLGYCFCRRSINLMAFAFPLAALALVVKLPWRIGHRVLEWLPFCIAQASEFDLWTESVKPAGLLAAVVAIMFLVLLFGLVAFVFVPLGQIIGRLIETASDGVYAYTVNVLASLAGILLYTLLCLGYQPPAVWFALSGVLAVILFWSRPALRWVALAAFAFCAGLSLLGVTPPDRVLWSPYQKVTLTPVPADHPIAYELTTNSAWYQKIINLSPEFVAAHPELFSSVPAEGNAYNIPYWFYPHPGSVLVLGAGMGNDVAAAVRNGAGRVTAVEIDPLILELGRRLHFEHPYQSPRVSVITDDARSYIQNSHDKFDLIVFSLLDSHTTASYYSNIRIDNYVYTREALQQAKKLLKPDGVFIVKFEVRTPWIAGRLFELMSSAFGQPPLDRTSLYSRYTTGGRFFVAGSEQRIQQAMRDPALRKYLLPSEPRAANVPLTTDDWPYFYQRTRSVPPTLLIFSLALAVFCWWLLERTGAGISSMHWHFLFLGAGFMLLETQIVSKMALLFGTTWMVNSLVVGGLLVLIAAANVLVHRYADFPRPAAYVGLFVTLAAAYLIPLQGYFFTSLWVKALAATAVLCLPAFFAGIIFIRSFAGAGFNGAALGSNLFGALLGGLLEPLSQWTGMRFLVVLAAILYAASAACLGSRKSMHGELAEEIHARESSA